MVNAGVCVSGAGDVVDAERYFNRALAIKPNMPEAMLELGNLALTAATASRLSSSCSAIWRVNPPSPEILWLGFRAERKLGDNTAPRCFGRRMQVEFPDSEQAQMLRSGVDR